MVTYKNPVVKGTLGHRCRHNLYGTSGVGGAIATRMTARATALGFY